MVSRRCDSKPPLTFKFWKKDGKLYYVEAAHLQAAIEASGHSEVILRRKLGAGYEELLGALKGKRFSIWTAVLLDWGLQPDKS